MASNNMYRVGDFVYFESSAGVPYQIRKIEELNKTTTGAVEAKVVCFYRRRDEPVHDLLSKTTELTESMPALTEREQHLLKHRELFITRQLETLPATHIRGKANVIYGCEHENLLDILESDNAFFYRYVFDPVQRTLHTGKSCIRVGLTYQAVIPRKMEVDGEYETSSRSIPQWFPDHGLREEEIDNYITMCRSLGTYARSVDLSSTVRQPNLAASAAAANRDITLVEAYNTLHSANYSVSKSVDLCLPNGCPVLVRDAMETWSASEGKLFEEGLGKLGKYFPQISKELLAWKSCSQLVEFYYMWKTSQHYLQLKRIKRTENEHKLRQVYIPNYTKPNPAVLYNEALSGGNGGAAPATNGAVVPGAAAASPSGTQSSGCESCGNLSSGQWFVWGTLALPCKLCEHCWTYWKRYGGLKNPSTQDKQQKDVANANHSILGLSSATIAGKTGHLYQCPQIGCDKLYRQTPQLQTHVVASHPELIQTLGGQWSSLEEFKNHKNGFIMKVTPELRMSRRVLRNQAVNNIRLGRCFHNREHRYQLATKAISRFQLAEMFNSFMLQPDSDLLSKKYRLRRFLTLDEVIANVMALKMVPPSNPCNGNTDKKPPSKVNTSTRKKDVSTNHMEVLKSEESSE